MARQTKKRQTTVGEWGERALIRWLLNRKQKKPARTRFPLEIGVGDDAAVIGSRQGSRLLISCDQLVQDVHFLIDRASPFDIGWKAAAVNISDIAGMGGRPLYLMVSLAASSTTRSAWVRSFYRGFLKVAGAHGVSLIGGDTSASPGPLFLDVVIIGESTRPILRSGAQPGDAIYVTRTLGDSAAGLQALQRGLRFPGLLKRHLQPQPEILIGQALAKHNIPSAMMDMSDGLSRDLRNLCEASGCGATIDVRALPISRDLQRFCDQMSSDPRHLALHGGEDYGLLLTVPPGKAKALRRVGAFHCIGTIIEHGIELDDGEAVRPLPEGSWEHFSRKDDS